MAADGRTFVVASDEALIELILGARNRLVVIAPALTQAVADQFRKYQTRTWAIGRRAFQERNFV
jgi:hypothetical protein